MGTCRDRAGSFLGASVGSTVADGMPDIPFMSSRLKGETPSNHLWLLPVLRAFLQRGCYGHFLRALLPLWESKGLITPMDVFALRSSFALFDRECKAARLMDQTFDILIKKQFLRISQACLVGMK